MTCETEKKMFLIEVTVHLGVTQMAQMFVEADMKRAKYPLKMAHSDRKPVYFLMVVS